MNGGGGTGWEMHTWKPGVEKPLSKGLALKGREKERNSREGQHRVFLLTESYFSLFKQEGIYRLGTDEDIGKRDEDN